MRNTCRLLSLLTPSTGSAHTCTHTCTHIHAYAHTHTHARTHTHMHRHIHKHTHTHTFTYTRMHIAHACTHAHTNTHSKTYTRTAVHTHTHTQTLINAHTHTHTHEMDDGNNFYSAATNVIWVRLRCHLECETFQHQRSSILCTSIPDSPRPELVHSSINAVRYSVHT